jgi:hypothetical protein
MNWSRAWSMSSSASLRADHDHCRSQHHGLKIYRRQYQSRRSVCAVPMVTTMHEFIWLGIAYVGIAFLMLKAIRGNSL